MSKAFKNITLSAAAITCPQASMPQCNIVAQELLDIYNQNQMSDTSQALQHNLSKTECEENYYKSLRMVSEIWHSSFLNYQKMVIRKRKRMLRTPTSQRPATLV